VADLSYRRLSSASGPMRLTTEANNDVTTNDAQANDPNDGLVIIDELEAMTVGQGSKLRNTAAL
jgi:hypothetical protein